MRSTSISSSPSLPLASSFTLLPPLRKSLLIVDSSLVTNAMPTAPATSRCDSPNVASIARASAKYRRTRYSRRHAAPAEVMPGTAGRKRSTTRRPPSSRCVPSSCATVNRSSWRARRTATSRPMPARSGMVIAGVLMCCDAVITISRRRGIPSVTLTPPEPARWNVLSVICVDGSPTDCAASAPTGSPGATIDLRYLTHIMTRKASLESLPSSAAPSSASTPPGLRSAKLERRSCIFSLTAPTWLPRLRRVTTGSPTTGRTAVDGIFFITPPPRNSTSSTVASPFSFTLRTVPVSHTWLPPAGDATLPASHPPSIDLRANTSTTEPFSYATASSSTSSSMSTSPAAPARLLASVAALTSRCMRAALTTSTSESAKNCECSENRCVSAALLRAMNARRSSEPSMNCELTVSTASSPYTNCTMPPLESRTV
mmetsp:Transcript_24752/g.86165  ORF Transcript_24752/g.86165 Transcript_24752/m.86165 type:complete len:429 (-) Transcript_24752:2948-4234(-)